MSKESIGHAQEETAGGGEESHDTVLHSSAVARVTGVGGAQAEDGRGQRDGCVGALLTDCCRDRRRPSGWCVEPVEAERIGASIGKQGPAGWAHRGRARRLLQGAA